MDANAVSRAESLAGDVSGSGVICLAIYRPDHELLRRQITSIRTQTFTNWRCIVGIDGSDPETMNSVLALAGDDDRFVIKEFEENLGFYHNFERLLAEVPVEASWVALSDQDDHWDPLKLAKLLPLLDHSTLAVGQARVVRVDGAVIDRTRRVDPGLVGLLLDNQVTGSLSVFRQELLRVALPFPRATDLAYHDHWLGIIAHCLDGVAIVPQIVQDYVQHENNVLGEEGRGTRPRARLQRLRRVSSGGIIDMIRYIADHRWGWRVNMAREALRRGVRPARSGDLRALKLVARGRLTPRLLFAVASCVAKREAPAARSASLLLGAAFWSARRSAGPTG